MCVPFFNINELICSWVSHGNLMLTQNHIGGRISTESRNTGFCELSIRFC